MSDTPNTDAAELRASDAGHPGYVHASFAREMERENEKLIARVGDAQIEAAALRRRVEKTETELRLWRDGEIVREEDRNEMIALRAEIDTLNIRHAAAMLHNQGVVDENTALRAEVERLKAEKIELCESMNHQMQRADKYWLLLCKTVEAMGKIAPESAPYADQWAADLNQRAERAEAVLTRLLSWEEKGGDIPPSVVRNLFEQARAAAKGGVAPIDCARFEQAPCYICGYNRENYYQPEAHHCAARYHAAKAKGGAT